MTSASTITTLRLLGTPGRVSRAVHKVRGSVAGGGANGGVMPTGVRVTVRQFGAINAATTANVYALGPGSFRLGAAIATATGGGGDAEETASGTLSGPVDEIEVELDCHTSDRPEVVLEIEYPREPPRAG